MCSIIKSDSNEFIFDLSNSSIEEKDDLRFHPINEYISGEIKPSFQFLSSNRVTVTYLMSSQGKGQIADNFGAKRQTNPNIHQGYHKEEVVTKNPFQTAPETVSRKESFSLKNKLIILSVLSSLPKSPSTYEMTNTEIGFLTTSNQRYSKYKNRPY